ncbi:hypothetical protein D3C85_1228230 [compost metagenome]
MLQRFAPGVYFGGPFISAELADGGLHAPELPGAFSRGVGQDEGCFGQVDPGVGTGVVLAGLAVPICGLPCEAGEVLRSFQFKGVAEPIGGDATVFHFIRGGALAIYLMDEIQDRAAIGRRDGGLSVGGLRRCGGCHRGAQGCKRGGKQAGRRLAGPRSLAVKLPRKSHELVSHYLKPHGSRRSGKAGASRYIHGLMAARV